MVTGKFLVKGYGTLTHIDEPKGVSWLSFGILALSDYPNKENKEQFDIVPVPTRELVAKKCGTLVVGDGFWASINASATSQADVYPEIIDFSKPISEEEIRQSGWYG
jgi:calcineurin-like phosphoesterase family protein